MIRFPKAKLNIGLAVTGKRADGYHTIESIFYPIPLCDVLEAIPSDSDQFNLQLSGIPIEGDVQNNLIYKAWNLLREKHHIRGIDAALMKVIPMGAGLGGGSSDGAHMLVLLNDLFELNLSNDTLRRYAATLGSDCPFFVDETPAFVSGRGEEITPHSLNLSGLYIAIINPNIHVGTAEAYQLITPNPANFNLRNLTVSSIRNWQQRVINDFEKPIMQRYDAIQKAKNVLIKSGALYASMTGSGSTVYGLFESEPQFTVETGWFVWKGTL